MIISAKPSPLSSSTSGAGARVFICYSRKDHEFVDRLAQRLTDRGIVALIDRGEVGAFEDWWDRIKNLILKSDSVVVIVTPFLVQSRVCLEEIAYAKSLNKKLAPILRRTTEDVPESVSQVQFISFEDDDDFDLACVKLADAVQTDLAWLRKHTEIGETARIWELGGRHRGLLIRTPALQAAEKWRASRPNGAPELTALQEQYIGASRKGLRQRIAMRMVASSAAFVAVIFLVSNVGFFIYIANPENRKVILQVITQALINYSGKEDRLPKLTALIDELEVDYERNPESSDVNSRLQAAYETAVATYTEMNAQYPAAKARRRQYDLILQIYEKSKSGTIAEKAAATEQLLFATVNVAEAYAAINDKRTRTFYIQAIQLFESKRTLNQETAAADLLIVRAYAYKAMHSADPTESKAAALEAIRAIDQAAAKKADLIAAQNSVSEPRRSKLISYVELSLKANRGLALTSLGVAQRQQSEKQLALATLEQANDAFEAANKDELKPMSEAYLLFIQNLLAELRSN